jgi:hypothetical protein
MGPSFKLPLGIAGLGMGPSQTGGVLVGLARFWCKFTRPMGPGLVLVCSYRV